MKQNRIDQLLQRLLTNKLTSHQRDAVRYWLANSEETDEKDAALKQVWDNTPSTPKKSVEPSLLDTYAKIEQAENNVVKITLAKRLLRYAAIFLLPLVSAFSVWMIMDHRQSSTLDMLTCYVPNGERWTINLDDGTTVQLNGGTLFVYPKAFGKQERSVYLVGEANFSVANDAQRPFIVQAKSLAVQVLGTKFNVTSYPSDDRITVTLETGAVKVYEKNNPHSGQLMRPNEQVSYSQKDKNFTKATVDAASFASWTTGGLFFDHQTLHDILAALERSYGIHFAVDPTLKDTDQYTLRIKPNESIEDVLHILVQIAGNQMRYKRDGQLIRLYQKGKEVSQ